MKPSINGKCSKYPKKSNNFQSRSTPERLSGQLTMPTPLWTSIFIVVFATCILPQHETEAQLMATSDTPGPISQLLQLVWEPSSLIRMWTALAQLYNDALGWRSAARQVAQLPFRQGRALDPHVKIKEPRRYRLQKKQSSDMPHWDWFKKVYEEGASDAAQQPVDVAGSHGHNLHQMSAQQSMHYPVFSNNLLQQYLSALRGNDPELNAKYLQQSFSDLRDNAQDSPVGSNNNFLPQFLSAPRDNVHNSLNAPGININAMLPLQQLPMTPGLGNSNRLQIGNPYPHMLPPPFQPQEAFLDYNAVEFPNKDGGFRRTVKLPSGGTVRKDGNSVNGQHGMYRPVSSNVPMMFFGANDAPTSNPETRLRMFLKLMGKLGEIHKKSVKAVEFDDDSSPDLVNNQYESS